MSPDDSAAAPVAAHQSGRADYDQLIQFRQLEPGEPYFFGRGRDPNTAKMARAYASLLYQFCSEQELPSRIPLVESALQQADRLDAWPTKKLPDASHLAPEEAKQLEFEFSRRAWDARHDSADERIMLAEERAIAAAFGQLRIPLSDLLDRLEPQENGDLLLRRERPGEGGRMVVDLDSVVALRRFVVTLGRRLPDPADPGCRMEIARTIYEVLRLGLTIPRMGVRELTWSEFVEGGAHVRYLKAADAVMGRSAELIQAVIAAYHALRCYERGEVSVDLARTVADHLHEQLAQVGRNVP